MVAERPPEEPRELVRWLWLRFAEVEADGRSPVYASIARHVAGDDAAVDFVLGLPAGIKRQPNLLLGAVQYLTGPLTGVEAFGVALATRGAEIADVVRERRTQTNLPARCATLAPLLASLPQPLALVEAGASAGLCLYPDRYGYDYDGTRAGPAAAVVFPCHVEGEPPAPRHELDVVWRAGLDLNPLDVTNEDDVRWLEALVWPGEEHLRDQLHAAIAVARAEPPVLVRGDLRHDLPALLDRAPAAATLVVLHTAVLSYLLEDRDRERFAAAVHDSGAVWIANEPPARIPGLAAEAAAACPPGTFVLAVDAVPVAHTDPHGSSVTWLPRDARQA